MKKTFDDLRALKRRMTEIVESHVEAWKSDFYEHDVLGLKKITSMTAERGHDYIFFWVVRKHGTFLQNMECEDAEEAAFKLGLLIQFPKARLYLIHFRNVNGGINYLFEGISHKKLADRIQKAIV